MAMKTVWLGLPDSDDIDCGNGGRLHIYPVDHATEVALKPESERGDHWVAVSLFAGKKGSVSVAFKEWFFACMRKAGVTHL